MPQTKNRFPANLSLDQLNALVEQTERNGWVLIQIDATTFDATDVNAAVLDAKMPNDGPFSRLVLQQDPPPAGTTVAFSSEVFVKGDKAKVNVVR